MFSKPVRVDTETAVKPAPKSFTITEYMKKAVIWTKYKIPELKQIAKQNHLHVSGTKPVLIERIQRFFEDSVLVIKIQKRVRGYFVRTSFRLRGPAFKNRSICVNDTDFYTMDPVAEIPYKDFYSYMDESKFIYGFDIQSIYSLYMQKGRIQNPYNREKISTDRIGEMLKLKRIIDIVYPKPKAQPVTRIPNVLLQNEQILVHTNATTSERVSAQTMVAPIPSRYQNHVDSLGELELRMRAIRAKPVHSRIIEVFMEIDQLGHYTSVEWFNHLDKREYYHFVKEIYNIWRYRAQLSNETKRKICIFDPFSHINGHMTYNELTTDTLKEHSLRIIENLVYAGVDNDHRNLGAFHILTALTYVSIPARTSMPWLYESVY